MSTSSEQSDDKEEVVCHYTFQYDTGKTEGRYGSYDFEAESDEEAMKLALESLKEGERPVNLWKTVSVRCWGDNEEPPFGD